MRTGYWVILALGTVGLAHADFSYTMSPKSSSAAATAGAATTTKYFIKGQKMKVTTGDNVNILDFDAQTVTTIRTGQQTYTVTPFSQLGDAVKQANVNASVEVKETGQKKTINGYNAREVLMTMDVESPQTQQFGKMQMEMDMWLSSDVPGASELHAFYQKNVNRFPWAALGGNNPSLAKGMADMQRKIAELGGVPVLQVVRVKPAGNSEQSAQLQGAMAQARARLEEMAKQGGPAGQAAQQALARMGAAPGGGALFEVNMEGSNFSTSSIPDSEFAVPAGYRKTDK